MKRTLIGSPQTIGELRDMTECLDRDTPLMHRNAPLPDRYFTEIEGIGHLEFFVPDVRTSERDFKALCPVHGTVLVLALVHFAKVKLACGCTIVALNGGFKDIANTQVSP